MFYQTSLSNAAVEGKEKKEVAHGATLFIFLFFFSRLRRAALLKLFVSPVFQGFYCFSFIHFFFPLVSCFCLLCICTTCHHGTPLFGCCITPFFSLFFLFVTFFCASSAWRSGLYCRREKIIKMVEPVFCDILCEKEEKELQHGEGRERRLFFFICFVLNEIQDSLLRSFFF